MKSTEMGTNGQQTDNRAAFDSTIPSGGITNVSKADNSPTMMNCPEMKERGSRADDLIEMAGDDSPTLGMEAPRKTKIKG